MEDPFQLLDPMARFRVPWVVDISHFRYVRDSIMRGVFSRLPHFFTELGKGFYVWARTPDEMLPLKNRTRLSVFTASYGSVERATFYEVTHKIHGLNDEVSESYGNDTRLRPNETWPRGWMRTVCVPHVQ